MGRQKKLPGVEAGDKPIEDIETAADAYRKAGAASQRQRKKTAEARDALAKALKDNSRTSYKAEDGYTYALAPGKEKIVITEPSDETEGGDDDDAGAED